jgi:iron complex outermembrane recepter protein
LNYLSRKQIYLSLFCATFLCANEATILEDVNIIESSNSILLKDISKEEIKSADLAEALSKNSANIQMVRRNGIANDII